MYCLTRNTTHNVNTKFKSQSVNFIGNRLKSHSLCRRWKTIFCWDKARILVHTKFCKIIIIVIFCFWLIPLNIANYILPSVIFKIFCHIFCITKQLFFIYCCTVTIPTIPTHWWGFCKFIFIHKNHLNLQLHSFSFRFCFVDTREFL